ncbi:hypothetical protein IGI37_002159 [Enterococcus sp. AZ194]|uniref:DeoR/GlpR family DNA-binding transcription regulator n=1 Tax=Enterococcus sp. AZ194 TaxID=2774629 RepID=UPI003F232B22
MENTREKEIMSYLSKHKRATHQQLCQELHCSLSTLRRDLIQLEKKRTIQRFRGGAILSETSNNEYSDSYRTTINIQQKKVIGELVRDYIRPNMCLFLDSSSTVYQLIPYILEIPNLIIITNGLKTALKISETDNGTIKAYMTGGAVKLNTSSVISNNLDLINSSFRFDIAFFSCRGLDYEGVYEASFSQAQMKKSMMDNAKLKILLADSSKFNSTHFFKIGTFTDYDVIVTNDKPNSQYNQICEENNIDLVYPESF